MYVMWCKYILSAMRLYSKSTYTYVIPATKIFTFLIWFLGLVITVKLLFSVICLLYACKESVISKLFFHFLILILLSTDNHYTHIFSFSIITLFFFFSNYWKKNSFKQKNSTLCVSIIVHLCVYVPNPSERVKTYAAFPVIAIKNLTFLIWFLAPVVQEKFQYMLLLYARIEVSFSSIFLYFTIFILHFHWQFLTLMFSFRFIAHFLFSSIQIGKSIGFVKIFDFRF